MRNEGRGEAPTTDPARMKAAALELFGKRSYSRAAEILRFLLQRSPADAQMMAALTICFARTQHWSEARRLVQQIRELHFAAGGGNSPMQDLADELAQLVGFEKRKAEGKGVHPQLQVEMRAHRKNKGV